MSAEVGRLVRELISNITCYDCDSELNLKLEDLDEGSDLLYEGNCSCSGCDAKYAIEIMDTCYALDLDAYRTDIEIQSDIGQMGITTRKEKLQKQTHPARNLIEGLNELKNALLILDQNQTQIHDVCEIVREEGIIGNSVTHQKVIAALHNYMASSYTFEEILSTVDPNLPTDGPVESAKSDFEERSRVIIGLRIYTQHHLSLPYSFTRFKNEDTDQWEMTITITLEDVKMIDSDTDRHPPDGYMKGSSHHYSGIEGEKINVENRINAHYTSAQNLVSEIYDYANEVHEDEIEDYKKSATYKYSEDENSN